MNGNRLFIEYLNEEFGLRKQKNPNYSLRAYARALDLNPAALSQILNGKRRVSQNYAKSVLEKTFIGVEKNHQILKAFSDINSASSKSKKILELQADAYNIVADPDYYAFLSLLETDIKSFDHNWLAGRLNINLKKIDQVIARLIRLGYIKRDREKYILCQDEMDTSYDVPNRCLVQRQFCNLEDAKKALEEVNIMAREFCSITMAIDLNKMSKAKDMIRDFRDKLSEEIETGDRTEVYEFSMQLFPRSQIDYQKRLEINKKKTTIKERK